jgi:hypothetical protein
MTGESLIEIDAQSRDDHGSDDAFSPRLSEFNPLQQRVERRAQGLSPVREAVVHSWRDLRMNEAPDDAIAFHLTQLLNQHLFRHGRYGTSQLGESSDLAAEQVKQDHEFPATLEDPHHVFDAFRRGRLGVFLLTFR